MEELSMAAAEKRTFSLPSEQAVYIDRLVASGTYATSSEVIRAGLRALQDVITSYSIHYTKLYDLDL